MVGKWTHDPERGKLRVAILVSLQVGVLCGKDVGYMYSNLMSNCNKVWIIVFDFDMVYMWKSLRVNVDAFVFSGFFFEGTVGWGIVGEMRKIGRARCERAIFWIGTESPTWSDGWGIGSRVENRRFFSERVWGFFLFVIWFERKGTSWLLGGWWIWGSEILKRVQDDGVKVQDDGRVKVQDDTRV